MKAALGGRDVGSEVALGTRIPEGGGEGRRDGSASYRRLFPATKLKTRPGRREGRGGVNTASQDNGLSGAQAMGHTNTLDDREGGAGLLRVAVKYRNREDGIYRTPNSGKYRTVMTVSTTLALGNTYWFRDGQDELFFENANICSHGFKMHGAKKLAIVDSKTNSLQSPVLRGV